MTTPSMLYGCELWGALSQNELNIFERVQKKIAKAIQGLHVRTHDEVTRGLLGWYTIKGQIDKIKLNFFYKLMRMAPTNIVKTVFLYEMFRIILSRTENNKSVTCDLWRTVQAYGLANVALEYFHDDRLISKTAWKQLVKSSVHEREEQLYRDGLAAKHAARFQRIKPDLKPSYIYYLMKTNLDKRKLLMNIIKLCAFVEIAGESVCNVCDQNYLDTVQHYVLRCPGLLSERCNFWDKILDAVSCESEARIMNLGESDTLDMLLGRSNNILIDLDAQNEFIVNVALNINSLMYVI